MFVMGFKLQHYPQCKLRWTQRVFRCREVCEISFSSVFALLFTASVQLMLNCFLTLMRILLFLPVDSLTGRTVVFKQIFQGLNSNANTSMNDLLSQRHERTCMKLTLYESSVTPHVVY